MEYINRSLRDFEVSIANVQNKIEEVEKNIGDVEIEIRKTEALIRTSTNASEVNHLRTEKAQLRTEKAQLRTEKAQLRNKEEQLRTEKAQFHDRAGIGATAVRIATTTASSSHESSRQLKDIQNNGERSSFSVELSSPTAKGPNHVVAKGFAAFLRSPLSLASPTACSEMAVTASDLQFVQGFESDLNMGKLLLSESSYYKGAVRFCLSSVASAGPGEGRNANSLYMHAFGHPRSHITLPSGCKPEFATAVTQRG
eukprot:gene26939-32551_t